MLFDCEHGIFNPEIANDMLMAARACDLPTIVRVQDCEYHCISKCLDMGADGVLIPRTETLEQVALAIGNAAVPVASITDTDYSAGRLKVYLAKPADMNSAAAPGTVITSGPKEGLIVACGTGCVELLEIQAPNAKRMTAKAYLMGKKIETGTRFGEAVGA